MVANRRSILQIADRSGSTASQRPSIPEAPPQCINGCPSTEETRRRLVALDSTWLVSCGNIVEHSVDVGDWDRCCCARRSAPWPQTRCLRARIAIHQQGKPPAVDKPRSNLLRSSLIALSMPRDTAEQHRSMATARDLCHSSDRTAQMPLPRRVGAFVSPCSAPERR